MPDLMQYIRNVYVDAVSFWRRQNTVEIPQQRTEVRNEFEKCFANAEKPVPPIHQLTTALIEVERQKTQSLHERVDTVLDIEAKLEHEHIKLEQMGVAVLNIVASLKIGRREIEQMVEEASTKMSSMFGVDCQEAIAMAKRGIERALNEREQGKKLVRKRYGVTYEEMPPLILEFGRQTNEKLKRIPDVLHDLKKRLKYLTHPAMPFEAREAYQQACIAYIGMTATKKSLDAAGRRLEEAYRATRVPSVPPSQPAVQTYTPPAKQKPKAKAPTNSAPSTYDILVGMGVPEQRAIRVGWMKPETLQLNREVLEGIVGEQCAQGMIAVNPSYFVTEVIDTPYERALRAAVAKGGIPVEVLASPKKLAQRHW